MINSNPPNPYYLIEVLATQDYRQQIQMLHGNEWTLCEQSNGEFAGNFKA